MSRKHVDIKPILLNIAGSAIVAFGLFNVHSISQVTEGGTLGLTLFFQHWLEISPAISGFILNVLCYALGAIVLGKGFILYSSVATVGFSFFYAIFEKIGYLFPKIVDYPLVAAIVGAMFVGIGVGLCVRGGGAPCGDDALAMSVSKLFHIGIRWVYLISDLAVLLMSLTYIPPIKLLFSLITVVLSGQIIGMVADFDFTKLNRYKRKSSEK